MQCILKKGEGMDIKLDKKFVDHTKCKTQLGIKSGGIG